MTSLRRRWGDDFQLRDLLDDQPGNLDLATRDFALLTLTAKLAVQFPDQLVLKGGFVLRHVYGLLRFSKDMDATRHDPPKQRLSSGAVADVIQAASIGNQIRFDAGSPATDSPRSLDFDRVKVTGALIQPTEIQVEISYREEVVDEPFPATIGMPFYDPFPVMAMQPHEIAAEKLRTLAQRSRPTDLADLAVVLQREDLRDEDVERVARKKFELVAKGAANRAVRIENNIKTIGADYNDTVPAVFPDAPTYAAAVEIVWPRIKPVIPA